MNIIAHNVNAQQVAAMGGNKAKIGISYMLRNTLRSSQGPIQAYTQHVATNIGNELSNMIIKTEFNSFREEFMSLHTLVETQRSLILALSFNLNNANRQ
jgi:hypothetical protein